VHLEAAHILKSYLFVPAMHPNLALIAPVYTLGWTLNYEMFFYLLFGFCLFVPSPRLRFALLAAAFLLLVAGGLLIQPQGAIARTYTDPIMLEFLAGVMLAILSPLLMRGGALLGLLLLATAIAWVAVVYGYGFVPERIVSHGIPAVTAVAGAVMLEANARRRPNRLWLMLGDASYSIYLAHPFAQRLLLIGVNRTVGLAFVSPTLYVLSAFVIGIAGGVICHFLLERPLLVAGRSLIGRSHPTR
jgi:peptidoglycan/LPS O-acetylase OafA/YrhL